MKNSLNINFFKSFKTVVFDCDGVILNSNKIKTKAFKTIAMRFGEIPAKKLVYYHTENGGISRQKKFEVLLKDILGLTDYEQQVHELSHDYGQEVYSGLLHCDLTNALEELKNQSLNQGWMIVSGGSQKEIRDIFKQRKIDHYFNLGIYGNPDAKDHIMQILVDTKTIEFPALFIGDSRYDHQISEKFGLDFVFISDWTEFSDWEDYCRKLNVKVLSKVEDFLS